ncbi:restriction endonuclease subunit S [Acetobacterium sp. K1/6]|jgi:type I restriction enzyme S subunit|uniref:restriction endonuclease subunit S n=1 Tax=Acetobacterium sp. K1/6 TaxID=3055467 RepID=UPI002ACA58A3|nr:restriction endonuclease subunit S [Acetobacterium sp. K1/6]MDZ5723668.1 restriction endonuclease subunit S [Acetobacterium sp. K1/6]
MSKLEALMAELCPKGVEFKSLSQVLTIKNGKDYKGFDKGDIPVYGTGGIMTFIDRAAFEKPSVLIPRKGSIDKLYYVDVPFWTVDTIFYTDINTDIIEPKFVFYYLQAQHLERLNTAGGVPSLTQAVLNSVKIPLPPLPVQGEIVRILDNFTELTAELTAELSARKKQYNYYRGELLSFGDQVPVTTLGNISIKSYSGGTPLANKAEYYGGDIPWLRTQEVRFVDIFDTEMRITPVALKNSSAKWIPKNCVIIAISGATAGRSAINRIPMTTNQHCCCLEINPQEANYRYVFHWVSCHYEKLKALGQGARSDLNSGIIKGYPIAVPPLEDQARIVAILDRFDTLCNDLSSGLPAEIEARRQQYEYYRDQLLTFPARANGETEVGA